ncbi:hypothetical protein CB0940_05630 [Cercospora beticola]|uniref:Uncharacterized protein n=1 Tax=Cercospora beticola TaxID=122368 RepID=A0A2G5HZ12_CERBT|nr:hypothetical protein CB0940_05630 [Cercospora beticola]PIA97523.1 hypothetical protein CB0940_05630 [Cercospora beticola]WPA98197.1 hypothetical protein RHO25_002808 [Cercospora beticola]CAK1359420.1 unnamed protein product [Cercospora beticola]
MASLPFCDSSSDDEDFHSMSAQGDSDAASHRSDEDDESVMAPPVHPCPQLQDAFEESIIEATQSPTDLPDPDTDAEMRRKRLLEAERDEDCPVVRWKQQPGAQYHPFVKLIAQLTFGMHLLKEGQAKSNQEVVKILQGHVNDVDMFLERTAEDFDLAIRDIEERIRYLKLPMQHMDVFEVMLDEKKFRTDLLNGNEKIERIIARTAKVMNAAMHDIHNGIKSTKELSTYLTRIEQRPRTDNPDIAEVFAAMRGNEQGWMSYLRDLRTKGDNLRNSLVILETVIAEIAKHAAAASRRNKTQGRQVSAGTQMSGTSSPLRSRFTRDMTPSTSRHSVRHSEVWLDKPLPKEPSSGRAAKQAAMAKPHPVPLSTRFEQPRQAVPAPPRVSAHDVIRPRTSSGASAREPTTNATESTRELSNFIRDCGPLRSNPPDAPRRPRSRARTNNATQAPSIPERHVRRSQSQNAAPATADPTNDRHTSRKPVAVAAHDDGTTPASSQTRSSMMRDGFSRRISKRLKSLPAPLMNTSRSSTPGPIKEFIPRPVDSAHSSERGKDDSEPDHVTPDRSERESSPELTALPVEKVDTASKKGTHGGHRLFPSPDPVSSTPRVLRRNRSADAKEFFTAFDGTSPQKPRSSRTSRSISLRRFFTHRKGGVEHVIVS